MTDLTLDAVRKRDAESAETWFKPFQGPQQFGAAGRAFVDRRFLLGEINSLTARLTKAEIEAERLQLLIDAMEECLGLREGQTFEARAEELIVTEVQHEHCGAPSRDSSKTGIPTGPYAPHCVGGGCWLERHKKT